MGFSDRLYHAWNAFLNKDPTSYYRNMGAGYSYRPDRPRLSQGNERSIVTSIFNRIALDVASLTFQPGPPDQVISKPGTAMTSP